MNTCTVFTKGKTIEVISISQKKVLICIQNGDREKGWLRKMEEGFYQILASN